jgi:protein SCO1/2
MRRAISAGIFLGVVVWLAIIGLGVLRPVRTAADNSRRGAGYFPNVVLTTQDGAPVRFYDDLVKGKIVAISLIYTTCKYACPLETARLAQVAKLLGDRMGRDVFFYSITIDPEHDTPQVLKEYAEKFHAGPGWTFLTGNPADIELISKKLGLYSEPNPRNPDGHTPMLLVGNEATGQWMRNSATDNAKFLARTIGDWLNSFQTAKTSAPSYATVPAMTLDRGEYTFRNHCAACHTIGRGDLVGPDLRGVTAKRDRQWLSRFITVPDQVLASGDPTARALAAKYKQVLMPNLGLGTADAEVLIDYLKKQGVAAADAAVTQVASHHGANLTTIVAPYLGIHRALSADLVTGVRDSARTISLEAAKLGAEAASIGTAADAVQQAGDLEGARASFGRLGDAILRYARAERASLGAGVKVAYCPMTRQYWLQEGDTVRNPFFGQRMSDCGRIASEIPTLTY